MFTFILGVTEADYRQFQRLHKKLRFKKLYAVMNVWIAIMALALAIAAAWLLYNGWWNKSLTRAYVILAAALAAWPLVNRLGVHLAYKRSYPFGQNIVRFEQDAIIEEANKVETKMRYDAIREIVAYRDAWYLYVAKYNAVLLPARCMIHGDPDAFGVFIAEKCGLEIKEIK